MKQLACMTSLFVLLVITVYANTEKAIFLAPIKISRPHPFTISGLDVLTPSSPSLRKSLPVAFPTHEQPQGVESWYLLKALNEGQRYEVRACWAAIQPTNFDIDVFDRDNIGETPELGQSILSFVQYQPETLDIARQGLSEGVLFLRIRAAADFFTTNETLMQSPPPVDVDIILDPYLANVFPKSLLPTAVYIICLAVGSWYFSGIIWSALKRAAGVEGKIHDD